MFIQRKAHLEHELVHWIVVLMLATAMALLAVSVAAARELRPDVPPGTLPPGIDDVSIPMWQYDDSATATPSIPEAPGPDGKPYSDFDLAMDLWMTMQDHRDGNLRRAIAGWERMTLPCDKEVWRYVSLGAAHLRDANLEAAFEALDTAESFDATNPVVHYQQAIMYLIHATTAKEWYDAIGQQTRYVSHTNHVPLTRSMYELSAIMKLEKAIELAGLVDPGELLLDVPWAVPDPYTLAMPICTPEVGDLLAAIGADNFVGKAHNMLGPLYLKHGSLLQAEEHMDAAVELGMNVLDGYTELGDKYMEEGQNSDAFRAYAKATARGNGIVEPARKAIESLRLPLFNDL